MNLLTKLRNRVKKANKGRANGTGYFIRSEYEGWIDRYSLMFRRTDDSVFHCCVLGDSTGDPKAILANLQNSLSE